ncbi:carotenoid oxygenase family protein [Mastigocoleus testarum]|uniref:Lignostilbene-alpha,beta-dioxygenase n=1 Tax=Mastigocoleus testarum BC008 TaxID=371196 RepID=A0A0V7ZRH5_9CYAN|nr:carotenoid oxygenase family protein [Mastigocoleus testarum]KST66951.1 lignostilbene-alpha,beta-dioxygenase [Mastigocoleus testarum BC008]KST67160.1 lignostilbene-alpha,beta-dioxygenase [Mastigocoleus testarum BC008]
MSLDVNKLRGSSKLANLSEYVEISEGTWPENLSGHVFIVAPFNRESDTHLFTGEGVIVRWDLKSENGKVKVNSKKLKTWDSLWYSSLLPIIKLFPKKFFPARTGFWGISEIANTAIVNMGGRLILTADAGRYWEADPNTLETLTPIGRFDEHIVSVPLSFFPMVANTAHPFYDEEVEELITCELKTTPRKENFVVDMTSAPYITRWDGEGTLKHWELAGTVLDGTPHTAIVTEKLIMIPDMPFQTGIAMLLGLKIPPRKAYPKTQMYIVKREDLKTNKETVPSRLVTFGGDSYHFVCNYRHIDNEIRFVTVQQGTISLTEAIEPGDVKHFSGESYPKECYGLPWMFAFDPGVLRKVVINEDAQLISEEVFIHPGWYTTVLYTADPRELKEKTGYSAIYQVYGGFHQDLVCRRQYMSFRDHGTRFFTDEQLPEEDLPCVLAKLPTDLNWEELTEKLKIEQQANPDTHLSELGRELLDFYVCPKGHLLDSIQFIPQEKGYIFISVVTPTGSEIWLFAADCLKQGPIAKINLSKKIDFGFTLHSEYFERLSERKSTYKVNRLASALGSLTKVPYEFFLNPRSDIVNRKVR